MPNRRIFVILALLVALTGVALAWLLRPQAPAAASFVGSQACAGCHQQAFEAWQQSHHRHAMELPDPASVRGDFANARFEYFGTTSRFFTRDGQYFVETDNARGEPETFRIAYTFGWYPLQQYLVEFPDGRLQALGISWDSRPAGEGGQRWFHLYPDEHVTHTDPLHWTGSFQNWNSRCASCHSTGVVKGYSQETDRYATRWAELTVGCEACHGPASRHVAWAQGNRRSPDHGFALELAPTWRPVDGQRPPLPAPGFAMNAQVQVCSACHSRRTELGQMDITAAFADNFMLSPLREGLYHADGQIREEVYETGSFLQSRMHQNHVSCSNCHEPHGIRLRAEGNALCTQCHERPRYDERAHHFHEPGSTGAQCVNCHMPQQTYMGVDVRRDHSFRVPDPATSLASGAPNACTQCHRDRNDKWAADLLARRSGRTQPWHAHATPLAAARRNDPAAAPALMSYAGSQGNPPILRAIALRESARFPSAQHLQAVAAAMGSDDPLLRAGAAESAEFLDPGRRLELLRPLLQDPVRSVRLAAARQLADVPLDRAPAQVRPQLESVFAEYRQALLHNADMPESMSDLGVFLVAQGDVPGAEAALLHARKLAPNYLPAMLNLADVYRARGRDDLGEPLLREALRMYPRSGDAYHMLGLLHVRTSRTPESVALFRQASQLAPDNPQYALVHAVSLAETGELAQAIGVLEAALRRFPANAALEQALAGYRSRLPLR